MNVLACRVVLHIARNLVPDRLDDSFKDHLLTYKLVVSIRYNTSLKSLVNPEPGVVSTSILNQKVSADKVRHSDLEIWELLASILRDLENPT